MSKFSELKLCFADLETTGLDENVHEIIELGALIYDPVEDRVVDQWEKKVAPRNIETAHPKALQINGYINNPESYTGSLKSALIKFNSISKDCIIIGQNIEFDLRFLRKYMDEFDIKPSFTHRNKLDLMAVAWPIIKNTDIAGLGLADFCNHFGVTNVGAHTALADCYRAFEVYRCLMKIYKEKL